MISFMTFFWVLATSRSGREFPLGLNVSPSAVMSATVRRWVEHPPGRQNRGKWRVQCSRKGVLGPLAVVGVENSYTCVAGSPSAEQRVGA